MKKITSMFLALVMALALTIPAFASSGTVKVEGSIQVPTLNVVLPTTASMVMNPYNMSVKLDPRDPASAVNDQIISPTMEVKNLSNIGVQVGIKVTGTKGRGDVEFATGSAASSSTKEAYVYVAFEIGNTGLDVADTNGSGTSTVVLSDTEQDVTDFLSTAAASNANTLAASADGKAPAADGVLGFKFFGDTAPVTTWTDKDTLAATIAFTFTPVAVDTTPAPTTYSITIGTITGGTVTADKSTATAGATVTLTPAPTTTGQTPTYTITGASGTTVTPTGNTFTMPAEDVTVTATFS